RRRQHRGLHTFVAFINWRDALFDMRFAQSGYAQFAMKKPKSGSALRQSWCDGSFKKSAHLFWRTRQQNNHAVALFDPQAWSGSSLIIQCFCAFRHHGLAGIDLRHFAAKAAKTGFDGVEDSLVALQFTAEKISHG